MAIEVPLPAQAEVIVKHLAGTTNTQISQDLGLARNTVAKILNEAQISNLTEEAKSILLGALPDSAKTIAKAVRKKTSDAWELLDRTGVLPKSNPDSNTNIAVGLVFEGLPPLGQTEARQPIEVNQSDAPATDSL